MYNSPYNPFDQLNEQLSEIYKLLVGLQNNAMPGSPTAILKEKPITTQQLCEYLGITEPTVLRWRKKKKIPFFTIGSAVRFNLSDVIQSLEKK